jgi:hypothetical protein
MKWAYAGKIHFVMIPHYAPCLLWTVRLCKNSGNRAAKAEQGYGIPSGIFASLPEKSVNHHKEERLDDRPEKTQRSLLY